MNDLWERLQLCFSDPHEVTIADSVLAIKNLIENDDGNIFDRIMFNIVLFLNKRSNNIGYFASVLSELLKEKNHFVEVFLSKIFTDVGPKSSYLAFIPRLMLVKMLVESGTISKEDYNKHLEMFYKNNGTYRYFFITILANHEELMSIGIKQKIVSILEEDYREDYLPIPLRTYYEIRTGSYKKIESVSIDESIRKAILEDNASDLAMIINSNPNFKLERRMESSIFEINPIVQSSPTMIEYAAFYGSARCFRVLFLKGAGVNLEDGVGRNLLEFAIAGGNTEIIRLLEQNPLTMLHAAAEYFRNDIFDWATLHFDIDLNDNNQKYDPLLHRCVAANNIVGVKWCLEHGSDPKLYFMEMTPLHVAARFDCAEAAKVLLENDIDVMSTNIEGDTPLHVAARHGSIAVLRELLLTPFIDVNLRDNDGKTALHVAVESRVVEAVRLIARNNGTDLCAVDSLGMRPYTLSLHIKRRDIGEVILEAMSARESGSNK